MKFFHVLSVALLCALFTSIGCSSGNYAYYTGGGTRCGDGYDPIKTDVTDQDQFNQPQNKVANFRFNDAGTYTYSGMEAYFHDLKTDAGVHTKMVIDPNTKVSTPTIVCTRNMTAFRNASTPTTPNTQPLIINQTVTALRSLMADGSGNAIKFQVGTIGYTYDPSPGHPALVATDSGANDGAGTLGNLYTGPGTFDSVMIYCVGTCLPTDTTKNYQIRASYTRNPDKPPFQNNQYFVEVVTYVTWTSTAPGSPTPPPVTGAAKASQKPPQPPPPPVELRRPPPTSSRSI